MCDARTQLLCKSLSTACKHERLGGRSAGTIDAIDLKGAVDSYTSALARFRQRHEDAAERGLSAVLRSYTLARALSLDISRSPEYLYIMDSIASKDNLSASRSRDENKENASTALKDPSTPPRKAPARDELKPLAMPKALKI